MRYRRASLSLLLVLSLSPALTGCGWLAFGEGGKLTAVSQDTEQRTTLTGAFDHALYRYDDKDSLTAVLFAGPIDQPTQAAVLRMFWLPKAGTTPVDPTANNARVHYIVFTDDKSDNQQSAGEGEDAKDIADGPTVAQNAAEVGVYSGAGFLYPRADPGGSRLKLQLWEASIQLADRSAGFDDRLGQSLLAGRFTAKRNDYKVSQWLQQLNARVNQDLGYPRLVHDQNQRTAPRLLARQLATSPAPAIAK